MPVVIQKDGIMARVAQFVELVQEMHRQHYGEVFPSLDVPIILIAGGQKYLKIISESIGGSLARPEKRQSVFCFIDLTNGDLLKPASFKAPAKHARGNIFEDDFAMRNVGPYGIAYLDSKGNLTPPAYAGAYNVQAEAS